VGKVLTEPRQLVTLPGKGRCVEPSGFRRVASPFQCGEANNKETGDVS
jgi:hypothetical protein